MVKGKLKMENKQYIVPQTEVVMVLTGMTMALANSKESAPGNSGGHMPYRKDQVF
jgi:hypothetical protein